MIRLKRVLFPVLAVGMFCTVLARADEDAEKGRAVFAAKKDAVVTVRAVLNLSSGQREKEDTTWANGAVLDPSGLTVLSLTFLDPFALYRNMSDKVPEVSVKVASLHILQPDGPEIPAEVVLRDEELDLVYVRPVTAPEKPLPFIDPSDAGSPQLLDTVAVISQLGEVARRAHTILLTRIEGLVEKPRKYYIPNEDRGKTLISAPAFTLDGHFVGMGAMRGIKSADGGGAGDNVVVILVSAQDIKAGMDQVPPRGAAPAAPAAPSEPVPPAAPAAPAEPAAPQPAPVPAPAQS